MLDGPELYCGAIRDHPKSEYRESDKEEAERVKPQYHVQKIRALSDDGRRNGLVPPVLSVHCARSVILEDQQAQRDGELVCRLFSVLSQRQRT